MVASLFTFNIVMHGCCWKYLIFPHLNIFISFSKNPLFFHNPGSLLLKKAQLWWIFFKIYLSVSQVQKYEYELEHLTQLGDLTKGCNFKYSNFKDPTYYWNSLKPVFPTQHRLHSFQILHFQLNPFPKLQILYHLVLF